MSRKVSLLKNECHGGQANNHTQNGKLLNGCQMVFTGKAGAPECSEYLSRFDETLVRTYSIFVSQPFAL